MIDQVMISKFGDATLDPDPIHIDPQWAAAQGPFTVTVAFGFQTMSLLTYLLHDALDSHPVDDPSSQGYFLNYGFDRMRLVSPVRVGSRIRGRFHTNDRTIDAKGRHVFKIGVEIETEGESRPALVGDWLTLWIPPSTT